MNVKGIRCRITGPDGVRHTAGFCVISSIRVCKTTRTATTRFNCYATQSAYDSGKAITMPDHKFVADNIEGLSADSLDELFNKVYYICLQADPFFEGGEIVN